MEQPTKEQILQRIEWEILKTVDIIAAYKEMTKPIAPENAIGRLSRMDAINNKAVTESALRQAEEKLDKLKFVRTKIDDADFGICKKCKCTIPIGRIILMPHSFYCVSCAK